MIERELKFAVDARDLPALKRAVAAAAQDRPARSTLVSTYFDTPDRALNNGKMALRVRKHGRRFVQTVKAEMGSDIAARGEWEDAIARPDPDLSAPQSGTRLQKVVHGAALEPLFTTTVKRTVARLAPLPTTLIEAAIDEGEIRADDGATSEPIAELELELKSGESAALYDMALRLLEVAPLRIETQSKAERGYRLVAGGKARPPVVHARPVRFPADATVETVLQEVGRRCLFDLVRNEPAALAGKAEAIHQMRVALRRLRSALAAVKPMLSAEHYAWVNESLKSLTRSLGAPRDWDVFADDLLRPVAAILAEEKGTLRHLETTVRRHRRRAYHEVRRAIAAPETTALILRLSRWFEARAWRDQPVSEQSAQLIQPIEALAPVLIARRFRQVRKRGKRFKSLAPVDRHRLRIACKKLRYTVDLLACLFDDKEVDAYLRTLKALQDDLGYANDVRTAHAILARLDNDGEGASLGRAGGLVLGWHERGMVDREKKLRKRVARFREKRPFW
jgi:inorganic triphosphatase YgiF